MCADPRRRQKNHEDLKKIYANVRKKTEPKPPRYGLTTSDALRLSALTCSKLSYGRVMAMYGSFEFDEAERMMRKDGYL